MAATCLVAAMAVGAVCAGILALADESPYATGASLITADGLGTSDVQARVDKLAEESMMTTAIPNPICVDGTRAYAVAETDENGKETLIPVIQNPAENTRDMKVSIVLNADNENEEVLYETDGLIRPGEGFETVELNRPISEGSHKASAIFEGYDQETHELLGTRIWAVTLIAS